VILIPIFLKNSFCAGWRACSEDLKKSHSATDKNILLKACGVRLDPQPILPITFQSSSPYP